MKVADNFGGKIALLAVVAILTLLPVYVFAQDSMDMNMDNAPILQEQPVIQSQPAVSGAGGLPTAVASNSVDTAYLYTGDIRTATPAKITGNMQMSVIDGSANDIADTRDKATVVANFVGDDGAKYIVRFTCINPIGAAGTTNFGGVGLQKQVFGSTNVGGGLGLPQTTAYVIAFGNVDITKDGQTLAEGQPAIALVTDALHSPEGAWLTCSDPSRQEIHLMVPGSLMTGGTAVAGFPNGYFYIYWPSASYQINNDGAVNLNEIATPGQAAVTTGRGPSLLNAPSQQVQQLTLTITNSSIDFPSGTMTSGPYDVTIVNNSTSSRGLLMTGRDICCSPFTRFNKVLAPGQSMTFRWFFAPGDVTVKDYRCATHVARSLTDATLGGLNTTITFQ